MNRLIKVAVIIFFVFTPLFGCANSTNKSNDNKMNIEMQNNETTEIQNIEPPLEKQTEQTTNQSNNAAEPEKEILEIKEKMFITQINDIFYNIDEYKNKIIVVEGMYSKWNKWNGDEKVPVVYRQGPGCCGNDGWGGFWLNYDGKLPNENDWIKVIGTPELVTEEYCLYLYLNVISLETQTKRGAEFVKQ